MEGGPLGLSWLRSERHVAGIVACTINHCGVGLHRFLIGYYFFLDDALRRRYYSVFTLQ